MNTVMRGHVVVTVPTPKNGRLLFARDVEKALLGADVAGLLVALDIGDARQFVGQPGPGDVGPYLAALLAEAAGVYVLGTHGAAVRRLTALLRASLPRPSEVWE